MIVPLLSTIAIALGLALTLIWSHASVTGKAALTPIGEIIIGFMPTYFLPSYLLAAAVALKFIWS